jgi:hypothetical protein
MDVKYALFDRTDLKFQIDHLVLIDAGAECGVKSQIPDDLTQPPALQRSVAARECRGSRSIRRDDAHRVVNDENGLAGRIDDALK